MAKTFKQRIRIRLRSFDQRLLERSAGDIVDTAKRTGAKIAGPVPLPSEEEHYTVLRSPHVHRKSREQFKITTHKRFIEIIDPPVKTLDALKGLSLPAGVDIKLKT